MVWRPRAAETHRHEVSGCVAGKPESGGQSVRAAAVALLGLLAPSLAFAQGYSVDAEVVRPGFSSMGLSGIDSPRVREAGTWRVGLLTQYERDPLVLYQFGNEVGSIVTHRAVQALGISYDVINRASVRVVLPVVEQWGTDVPELSASGVGQGDLSIGGSVDAYHLGPVALGLRLEIVAPTARQDFWVGEKNLRVGGGLLAHLDLGRFDTLLDVGPVLRTGVKTQEDFELESELAGGLGFRFDVIKDRVSPYVMTFTRTPLSAPFSGGAETPAESVIGVQVRPIESLLLDLGVGKGWADGYGTTQERVMLGATWRAKFPKREKPPQLEAVVITEPPPEPPEPPPVVPEDKGWKEGELARVVGEQIQIRDPIQFEFNTERVLPESLPILYAVADLLEKNDRLGHIVVEGHASEEGSYEYNYDLSIRRARAIWEHLIRAGVNPNRISYRGMGEVVPLSTGEDEATLAANRRVEFDIVYQLGQLDLAPEFPKLRSLPWNGGAPASERPERSGRLPEVELNIEHTTKPQIDANTFRDDDDAGPPAPEEKDVDGELDLTAPRPPKPTPKGKAGDARAADPRDEEGDDTLDLSAPRSSKPAPKAAPQVVVPKVDEEEPPPPAGASDEEEELDLTAPKPKKKESSADEKKKSDDDEVLDLE